MTHTKQPQVLTGEVFVLAGKLSTYHYEIADYLESLGAVHGRTDNATMGIVADHAEDSSLSWLRRSQSYKNGNMRIYLESALEKHIQSLLTDAALLEARQKARGINPPENYGAW